MAHKSMPFDNIKTVVSSVFGFLYQMSQDGPVDIYLLSGNQSNSDTVVKELTDMISKNKIKISSLNNISDYTKFSQEIGVDVETGEIMTENIQESLPPIKLDKLEGLRIINQSFANIVAIERGERVQVPIKYPNGNPWMLDRAKAGECKV